MDGVFAAFEAVWVFDLLYEVCNSFLFWQRPIDLDITDVRQVRHKVPNSILFHIKSSLFFL